MRRSQCFGRKGTLGCCAISDRQLIVIIFSFFLLPKHIYCNQLRNAVERYKSRWNEEEIPYQSIIPLPMHYRIDHFQRLTHDENYWNLPSMATNKYDCMTLYIYWNDTSRINTLTPDVSKCKIREPIKEWSRNFFSKMTTGSPGDALSPTYTLIQRRPSL